MQAKRFSAHGRSWRDLADAGTGFREHTAARVHSKAASDVLLHSVPGRPTMSTALSETPPGFYQHKTALVESCNIGNHTRVWAFTHILPDATIGVDCNICDHVFIENDVIIGDRVTIKCGVQLWDGLRVEDDVFIGPNVTFTNDRFPRSKKYLQRVLPTYIRAGASIGANATILPELTIGERAMIGAGAVVTRNVPPDAIVTGNPGRIVGYVGANAAHAELKLPPAEPGVQASTVHGAIVHRLPLIKDLRGSLTFGQFQRHLPFEVKRYFLVFDVSSAHIRGEHAHRTLHQFLVCVRGKCHCVADDGTNRQEFVLGEPTVGLYLAPMTWAVEYKYSPDAMLLVLASDLYDAQDYIRDYSEFVALKHAPGTS